MVIWTDKAILHITEIFNEAKVDSQTNIKNYINKLVDYTETLDDMPKIGKIIKYFFDNTYEIRQLIYKKHRIIYNIKDNNVVILSVISTKLDLDKALKRLQKYIKNTN